MASILFHEFDKENILDPLIENLSETSPHTFYSCDAYDSTSHLSYQYWDSACCFIKELDYLLGFSAEILDVLTRQYTLEPRKSKSVQEYIDEIKNKYVYLKKKTFNKPIDLIVFGNYPHDGFSLLIAGIAAYNNIPYYAMHPVVSSPCFSLVRGSGRSQPFAWQFSNRVVPSAKDKYSLSKSGIDQDPYIELFLDELSAGGKYTHLPNKEIQHFPSFRKILTSRSSTISKAKHFVWGAWTKYRQRQFEDLLRVKELHFDLHNHPYVFFPLHLQPEMTTSALGGRVLNNQLLAVELIAEMCSELGINLVLKEHYMQSFAYRPLDSYTPILDLPHVHLAPLSVPTHELISNSLLVATISGTAGFEALYYGKKSLVLGTVWYENFPGVFNSIETAQSYLRKSDLLNLTSVVDPSSSQPDRRLHCRKLLQQLADESWIGSPWFWTTSQQFGLTTIDNSRAIAASLNAFFTKIGLIY